MIVGLVTAVEQRLIGSELVVDAAIGATSLVVDHSTDFDEDGGMLLLGDEILSYTGVDSETDTITLAVALDVAADADDPVQVIEGGLSSVSWVAHVAIDDSDPIPAVIPTALVPYFTEGTYEERIYAELRLRADGAYEVTTQPSRAPDFDYAVRVSADEESIAGGVDSVGNVTAADFTATGTVTLDSADTLVDGMTLASLLGLDAAPPTGTFSKTYAATDTKWYGGSGNLGGSGDNQYFGVIDTASGRRKSVIWFNKSLIVSDLAGVTVTKVEVYLYLHNGGNGNNVGIGSHTDTSPGAASTYGVIAGTNRQRDTSLNWNEGTGRWVDVTFDLAEWGDSGVGKIAGLVIGPASSDAANYAAGYRGATHSQHPKLRITGTIP